MFCRKLIGDREQGDDLFQDALVAACVGFPQLRDHAAFRPWFYRIMVNTFRSQTRRPWWKRFVPLTSEIELNLPGDNPVDVLAARHWLSRAFKALSAEDQALVTLYELEDWTIAELAHLYDKTEGAIKLRLFRARRKMRDRLLSFSRQSKSQKTTGSPEGN